jgi:hypothetical protein
VESIITRVGPSVARLSVGQPLRGWAICRKWTANEQAARSTSNAPERLRGDNACSIPSASDVRAAALVRVLDNPVGFHHFFEAQEKVHEQVVWSPARLRPPSTSPMRQASSELASAP